MQCGFLDWILDQKRSLVGKVVNSKWSLQFSVLVKSCITHVDFLDLTHGPGLQVDFRGAGWRVHSNPLDYLGNFSANLTLSQNKEHDFPKIPLDIRYEGERGKKARAEAERPASGFWGQPDEGLWQASRVVILTWERGFLLSCVMGPRKKSGSQCEGCWAGGMPPYLREGQLFVLFQPSTDWTRPTTLRRAICFTQSTNATMSLLQKHVQRDTQNNVWPNVWAPRSPVEWTYKINLLKGRAKLLIFKLRQLVFGSCAQGYCRELILSSFWADSIFILSHYLALTVAVDFLREDLILFISILAVAA